MKLPNHRASFHCQELLVSSGQVISDPESLVFKCPSLMQPETQKFGALELKRPMSGGKLIGRGPGGYYYKLPEIKT